jgi:hypothetical protein
MIWELYRLIMYVKIRPLCRDVVSEMDHDK